MRPFWKYLKYVPIVVAFYMSCVFHKITHMTEDDLQWATNRKVGEAMIFESDEGEQDTVVITSIDIYNSINPINTYPNSMTDYLAGADIKYIVRHNQDYFDGWLGIEKRNNGESLWFSAHFDHRFAYNLKSQDYSFCVSHVETVADCVIVNENNSRLGKHNKQTNPVLSFVWSKEYGLIQYSFKDGTMYKRKFNY
ncbi:MAG: hypothetical protein NC431_07785 [Firmicutes bacterium]|nr:hypothetical protein [Bacillota bacterium]